MPTQPPPIPRFTMPPRRCIVPGCSASAAPEPMTADEQCCPDLVTTGHDELRRTAGLCSNMRSGFCDGFTPAQLIQLWRMYHRCGWDFAPDTWHPDQVTQALAGVVPRWDEEGEPVFADGPAAAAQVESEGPASCASQMHPPPPAVTKPPPCVQCDAFAEKLAELRRENESLRAELAARRPSPGLVQELCAMLDNRERRTLGKVLHRVLPTVFEDMATTLAMLPKGAGREDCIKQIRGIVLEHNDTGVTFIWPELDAFPPGSVH